VGHLTHFISSQGLKVLENEVGGRWNAAEKQAASAFDGMSFLCKPFTKPNNQKRRIYYTFPKVKCKIQHL